MDLLTSSGFEKVSSLRLVFLLSSGDPGPWDPGAVEPSTGPGGQDLAEPETPEAEAAPVSKAATRTARLPTICSTLATLLVVAATVCESVWTQLSTLETLSGHFIDLIFAGAGSATCSLKVRSRTIRRNQHLKIVSSSNQARKCALHLQTCDR